jgi:hypothetical protein
MESAATIPSVGRLQTEAAGAKPPLPRAPKGQGSKNPLLLEREGHPYEIFFHALATARDATNFFGGLDDRRCNAFVR